jgi:hypothetical protein
LLLLTKPEKQERRKELGDDDSRQLGRTSWFAGSLCGSGDSELGWPQRSSPDR